MGLKRTKRVINFLLSTSEKVIFISIDQVIISGLNEPPMENRILIVVRGTLIILYYIFLQYLLIYRYVCVATITTTATTLPALREYAHIHYAQYLYIINKFFLM